MSELKPEGMTAKQNKPYNPFKNGLNTYDLSWLDLCIQVVGDKDNFVIYGRHKSGEVYVLNIVGNEVFEYDET